MFSSEISLAAIIIAIAGGISVIALLFSRLLIFFDSRDSAKLNTDLSGYECGFESDLREDFIYLTEKVSFISIYLIFELVIFWLLLCCAFDVATKDWSGKLFIKVFLFVIFVIMLISYRFLFYRNAQK